MNDFVDDNGSAKSCWSVTGWALVAALAMGVAGSVLAGSGTGEDLAVVAERVGS